MDRVRLGELSLGDLKEEALKYGLPLSDRRDVLIDRIMTYFERHAPALDLVQSEEAGMSEETSRGNLDMN